MSGLKFMRDVLESLDEAKRSGVHTFREIISSYSGSRVRHIIATGGVLGVQEFDCPFAGSLVGKEIDTKESDPIHEPNNSALHLYRVIGRLHCAGSPAEPAVYKNDCRSWERSGVFEVHPSFDDVCVSHDAKFMGKLKPAAKYSIVTPSMRLDFPAWRGCRNTIPGAYRATDGTAIIDAPFSFDSSSELAEILEDIHPGQGADTALYRAENAFEQGARVIHAVMANPDFKALGEHFVQLNAEVTERSKVEHYAGMGNLG